MDKANMLTVRKLYKFAVTAQRHSGCLAFRIGHHVAMSQVPLLVNKKTAHSTRHHVELLVNKKNCTLNRDRDRVPCKEESS